MIRIHSTNKEKLVVESRIQGGGGGFMKPNGLWYGIGNDWLEWCEENTDWEYKYHFELILDTSKILILNSLEKILQFNHQYAKFHLGLKIFRNIDWVQVAKEYSGLEINPYQWEARLDFLWYYGWDVAGGCVWDKDVVINIKRCEYE